MLSRVAESIYWMSRYIERAENLARFVDVNLHLMLDLPPGTDAQWEPLVRTTADIPAFSERYGEATRDSVIEFLTFDLDNPNSILRCLEASRDNARSVREAISSEVWEQVNKFYLLVRSAAFRELAAADPYTFFGRIKMESHLFAGTMGATMSHGEGWHFARLGRKLERADKTSRILDVKYFILLPEVSDIGTPLDDLQWSALLKSASALEMFRKRHHRLSPERVAEFLLLDRDFPRSVLNCIEAAAESLHAISGSKPGTYSSPAEQLLGRLQSQLNYTSVHEIIGGGLHEYLDDLEQRLNQIGEAIHATFFELSALPEPAASGQAALGLE